MDSSERMPLLEDQKKYTAKAHSNRRYWIGGLVTAIIVLIWSSTYIISTPSSEPSPTLFDFEQIVPSEKLQWHPCYGSYKCARLTVPMDYHRPLNVSKNHPKVHIALLLVPGTHNGANEYSDSPLLLNPGGPGGAGATFALLLGGHLQKIVGTHQDIIGFDPRGIGATTPHTDCFSTLTDEGEWDYVRGDYHRLIWTTSGAGLGIVNSSSDSLRQLDIRARAVAKLCKTKDTLLGDDSIFKYVNTPNVARDMLSIVDAWDEWTKTTTLDSLNAPRSAEFYGKQIDAEEDLVTDRSDVKGKLVYWGFSYGTLLGATFASMFPDRVGRVVLDGVVDADHYVSPIWGDSIRDDDAIIYSFFKYCHRAGTECMLYRPDDEISDLQERFESVMGSIQDRPFVAMNHLSNLPRIITYSDLKTIVFASLYAPMQMFPLLAAVCDIFYRGIEQDFDHPDPRFELEPRCGPPPPLSTIPGEAQISIMCSDKRYNLNETLPNLEAKFEELSNLSSMADVWMTLMIGCDNWSIEAKDPPMRWDDHPSHKQKPIKTSFPVLFLSNTGDPVTPLKAGIHMAGKFVDSGLIEQKSEGHCSLAAVSICTIKNIQAYFNDGKVPPHPIKGGGDKELVDGKWLKCEADEYPFHPFDGNAYLAKDKSDTSIDVESISAWKEMQKTFSKQKFWGQYRGVELEPYMFRD